MRKLAFILTWLLSLVLVAMIASNISIKKQQSKTRFLLAESQAIDNFNHAARYKDIEIFLVKGCSSEALEMIKISKNFEMSLLADYLQSNPKTSLNKYISGRDSRMLVQLANFKNPYGTQWVEPQCSK